MNGFHQARGLTLVYDYDKNWIWDIRFITGTTLWLYGFYKNLESDQILRNLRKIGERGYKIPHGGLFDYVTSANYYSEILEWSGFAIATWNISGFAFLICCIGNLVPHAYVNHKWYIFLKNLNLIFLGTLKNLKIIQKIEK